MARRRRRGGVFTACFDAAGKLDKIEVTGSNAKLDPAFAGYPAAVTAAARTWTVKPFTVRGKPVRACVQDTASDPPNAPGLDEEIVRDIEESEARSANITLTIPPKYFERLRTAGTATLTSAEIAKLGGKPSVAVYSVCIDTTGAIAKVTPIVAATPAATDQAITSKLRAWRFKPFLFDGRAMAMCASYDL